MRENKKKIHPKKVVCLNTNEVFDSLGKAYKCYGVTTANISSCCTGRLKSAGKLNGEPLVWRFKEEFDKLTEKEIKSILFNTKNPKKRTKEVICLNNLIKYKSITDASNKTNISITSISLCCSGIKKFAGYINGNKATWMYYNDYKNLNNCI